MVSFIVASVGRLYPLSERFAQLQAILWHIYRYICLLERRGNHDIIAVSIRFVPTVNQEHGYLLRERQLTSLFTSLMSVFCVPLLSCGRCWRDVFQFASTWNRARLVRPVELTISFHHRQSSAIRSTNDSFCSKRRTRHCYFSLLCGEPNNCIGL